MKIPDANRRLRHAVLLAFLDDAIRRVLHASFSFSENSLAFEAGIKHILGAHGRIGRLYCDHGSAFMSRQMRRILNTLGIILVQSQVARPRGKIERLWRTVRMQLLPPLSEELTLQELNEHLWEWIDKEYHVRIHGSTEMAPLKRFLQHIELIRPAPKDLREYFRKP